MKIEKAVSPEEVPEVKRPYPEGVWTSLVRKVIEAYQQGKVLVVTVDNHEEYKRMRNGMAAYIRDAGYVLHATITPDQGDAEHVYLQLEEREKQPMSVVQGPVGRRRRA